MPIITLTTDFGTRDHFAGATKGFIYSELPEAVIVDISHEISPFNIIEAAYILKNAYKTFPKGTVHLIGVDSELTPENRHIAVTIDGHHFVGADNGILSFLTQEIVPEKMVEINIHDRVQGTFPIIEVFVKVGAHIARGGTLEVIGKPITALKEISGMTPQVNSSGDQISGSVIYIDNYGNVITNISRKLFEAHHKGRKFELWARNHRFTRIRERYSDVVNFDIEKAKRNDDGEKLALFNSGNLIELAVYKSNLQTVGGASGLLGLKFRDAITIKFS